MELLITLLIYILVFALIYYVVIAILGFLETAPGLIKIAKVIMLGIFLIFILALVFGGDYLPRLHFDHK